MSWFEDNLDKIKIGLEGEEIIREHFKKQNVSPPFDGHGLPQWQIDRRMEFYKDTGVVPVFIVYDLKEKCVFMQKLNFLNTLTSKNDVLRTKGAKPRTIFNIKHFEKIKI